MFDRFTDPARRAVTRAGILTMNAGRTSLATDLLLLGLAEEQPMPHLPDPDALRPHIDTGRTRELLAAIGIDVDEVRRRTRHGLDDPGLWRLERSRVAFLRVTLSGPMGVLPLQMHARKAIEVAMWKPGPVTGERLLWGLLADAANGSARILREAGADVRELVRVAGIPVHRATSR
ncbi:Clp protease N-terminal domain-containing protein [Nonomuraea dietziae]|uniref:Clp protease N-terminal domain-containing protein n=1 Tax=Nonomuraea dietziae TaxID=65515 RepID=UPI0033C9FA2C